MVEDDPRACFASHLTKLTKHAVTPSNGPARTFSADKAGKNMNVTVTGRLQLNIPFRGHSNLPSSRQSITIR